MLSFGTQSRVFLSAFQKTENLRFPIAAQFSVARLKFDVFMANELKSFFLSFIIEFNFQGARMDFPEVKYAKNANRTLRSLHGPVVAVRKV